MTLNYCQEKPDIKSANIILITMTSNCHKETANTHIKKAIALFGQQPFLYGISVNVPLPVSNSRHTSARIHRQGFETRCNVQGFHPSDYTLHY